MGSRKVPDRGPQGSRFGFPGRTRRTNERLALSVAALFAFTGLLPITLPQHRDGVLWTAAVLLLVTLIWFRVVPARALGDRRVATFGVLLQPVVLVLLSLTGGNDSPYFPYILLPVLVTVYSPSTRHTLFVGAVSGVTLVAVSVLTHGVDARSLIAEGLATDLIELLAFLLFTAFAGRALRDARRAITVRAEELAHERTTAMELAFTDTLTGLYNRRYADDLLKRLVSEAARGRPFSVVASTSTASNASTTRSGTRLATASSRGSVSSSGSSSAASMCPSGWVVMSSSRYFRVRARIRPRRWESASARRSGTTTGRRSECLSPSAWARPNGAAGRAGTTL